ncbi:MAG: threonine/serine dehydratase [Bryobacteraceae bacterium]|nr:threonine/serine dehydratase [Bryobacteraceae bacterium]
MPEFADIQQAAVRIAPLAKRTPVLTSQLFNKQAGFECFFKCENLQRGGSFKIRGAANFLLSMEADDLARGVVAFSSGNHAQAVAVAARHTGARATIVMPQDAPEAKIEATRAYGAEVILYDRFKDDREVIGRNIAEKTGATLVPPFDHEWIIAGQGTAMLELLEEVPDLDTVVVCVGGGGLLAGSATVVKTISDQIRVFGVEPELANDTWLSLQAGHRVGIGQSATIADGLRSPMPGALTFPIVQRLVDGIVLVTETEIQAAQAFVASRMKLVVEPSGAVSAGAVLAHKIPGSTRRAGVIFSGGNV